MPVKFTVKPHMAAKDKAAPAAPEPETETGDHELIFQIKDFPQNYLKYHAHKNTAGPRKPRHHNVVHMSDLDPSRKWCPREPALLTALGKTRPQEYLGTALTTTYRFGNKGADLFIEMLPPAMVWGHWRCRACNHVTEFSYTPEKCGKCGANRAALRYKEVFMRDPQMGIVGSVDLFVDILGNGVRTGVEIKTEGNDKFKKRNKPEFEHEWRSKGYLWLMEQAPQVQGRGLNLKEMRVVYITKEGWDADPQIKEWGLSDSAKSSLKEYWVSRDDSAIANQIDRAWQYRAWRSAWDSGAPMSLPLPDRHPHCTSPACTRAKSCPVRAQCWENS